MTSPVKPNLVRLWDEAWQEQASDFVMWHRGFRVDGDHPLAMPLLRSDPDEMGRFKITVYATDELVWKVDKWEKDRNDLVRVYCRPYIEVVRQQLMPDDPLLEKWLAAERKFFEDAVRELLTIRAQPMLVRKPTLWESVRDALGVRR